MNSLTNLEQLAFDRGVQAFQDYLKDKFPLIRIENLYREYVGTYSEGDYEEWASREMIKNMRGNAKREIRKGS